MGIKAYIGNVAIALDRALNAVLLGDPRETVSSRMGRHVVEGRCVTCKVICRMLDVFWPDHCIHNIEKIDDPKTNNKGE